MAAGLPGPTPLPRHLACEIVDGVLIAVQTCHPPGDAEWEDYLRHIQRAAEEVQRDYRRLRQIVFSDGGVPDGDQRERLLALTQARPASKDARVALVTSNALQRGVVTVLGWLGISIDAFPPSRIEAALDFARVPAEATPMVRAAAHRLGATLEGGVPRVVTLSWRTPC